ncbi:DUF4123 domain-containing protein [Vibrio aerogenes]|uniref:DUF4123 domain-containing protein n=1 Tax=Vibrio aerogenes TaxID=92172 RepID=UPI0021C3A9B3|nr:DUF4123 domain-containing protein [Vibrio aerogenes]
MMLRFDTPAPDIYAKSGQLYLLVDGGQIPDLARSLYQLPDIQTPEPIYLYPPYDELKAVSPWLIKATAEVRLWFLAQHQPTAGFFFSSDKTQDEIGDQLRTLIEVVSPYGSEVFLKMAHPEAALILLDSHCAQLWDLIQTAWLPTRDGWQIRHRPDLAGALKQLPYKLDDTQWAAFDEISWRNALEDIYLHMEKHFPHSLHEQSDPLTWTEKLTEQAYQLGFTTQDDVIHYLSIAGWLGEAALTSEKYPQIHQLIHQPSQQTPSQRIEQAAQLAEQYHSSPALQESVV